jgi:hypothetical protein
MTDERFEVDGKVVPLRVHVKYRTGRPPGREWTADARLPEWVTPGDMVDVHGEGPDQVAAKRDLIRDANVKAARYADARRRRLADQS